MDNWKILELATKDENGTVMNEVYCNDNLEIVTTYDKAILWVGNHRKSGDSAIIQYASGRTVEFEPELTLIKSWQ